MDVVESVLNPNIEPKTESGKRLVRFAEGLEKWSAEDVLFGEVVSVLGGTALIGAASILFVNGIDVSGMGRFWGVTGDYPTDIVGVARALVVNTEGIRVSTWDTATVSLNISPEERQSLLKDLFNFEKFKAVREGAALTLLSAGLGIAWLAGRKDGELKRSTDFFPAVARAVKSVGRML